MDGGDEDVGEEEEFRGETVMCRRFCALSVVHLNNANPTSGFPRRSIDPNDSSNIRLVQPWQARFLVSVGSLAGGGVVVGRSTGVGVASVPLAVMPTGNWHRPSENSGVGPPRFTLLRIACGGSGLDRWVINCEPWRDILDYA